MNRSTWWCSLGLLFSLVVPAAVKEARGQEVESPSTAYSRPVRVHGVDFEVVSEVVWQRPAEVYGQATATIGLRVSNHTDKDLTFDLGDTLRLSLKPVDGDEMIVHPVPEHFQPQPFKVAAGESQTVTLPTHLVHTRIRSVCLGLKGPGGTRYLTHDVPPGRYLLCLSCEADAQCDDAWQGRVETETLNIEVSPEQ